MTARFRWIDSRSAVLAIFAVLATVSEGSAQTGTTVTPDRRTFLVNKNLGAERWTISAGLATGDIESIISATGNVFRADGGPPSFVLCQIRDDSTGTLADPESVFRLACRGTDACQTTARECSRDEWQPIADLVEIPASFFLPPGGLGGLARASAPQSRAAAWLSWAAGWVGKALGGSASNALQASDRGATLSLDRLTYLVNKDVGDQRWSIGLNFVPVQGAGGGATSEALSVTGNVFFPDGREPSFVYCTVREDSTGTLEDAASEFRFSCSGAGACNDTADGCATTAWTLLADDVRLSASFFLPPGGLPPSVQSDPEIVVVGRTSDPPSIVTKDFTITGTSALSRPAGGGCPIGSACIASRIGSCTDVAGELVEPEGFGCGCEVENVAPECITCGGGATGACGTTGSYPVGNSGALARGVCLPFSAQSSDCVLFAVGRGGTEDTVVEACAGTLRVECGGGGCCADDPRDGCDPRAAGGGCSGVCVAADGCAPGSAECGICFASGPAPDRCGDGTVDPAEECDGSDEACGTGSRCDVDCRCIPDEPQPTPTPADLKPVVTSFTCNGSSSCSFPTNVEFTLTFEFEDPDGDASSWTLYLDGQEVNSGSISPPSASGEVSVNYTTGICPTSCCIPTDFTYTVTVRDAAGSVSDVGGPVVQTTEFTCS